MLRKFMALVLIVASCICGCYNASGNERLSSEESREKISISDTIKIDVHNLTFNNDVDVYVEADKVGDISGRFVAIWETLKFTDADGNIIRIGKQNPYLVFDNWTIYNDSDEMLFIMKENFTLAGISYDILDADEEMSATLKRGAIQLTNSAVIKNSEGEVIANIEQKAFRNDFEIIFENVIDIDKESLIIISTNYMMQKLYHDQKSK